jgi:hypothetical protein
MQACVGLEATGLFVVAKKPGRGFKESLTTTGKLIRLARLLFKVMQIGLADAAAHSFEMKINVIGRSSTESPQQVAANLSSRGAAQSSPLPDFSKGVSALIPMSDHLRDSSLQGWVRSQLRLKLCHSNRRKQFVQPGSQFSIRPRHH